MDVSTQKSSHRWDLSFTQCGCIVAGVSCPLHSVCTRTIHCCILFENCMFFGTNFILFHMYCFKLHHYKNTQNDIHLHPTCTL